MDRYIITITIIRIATLGIPWMPSFDLASIQLLGAFLAPTDPVIGISYLELF